VPLYSHLL